ncbi:MAG: CHAT domain-containing protein [Acidobacteria bacterium]|nr:CHAT domain-containing protein [Acidobacteriota bacterium]
MTRTSVQHRFFFLFVMLCLPGLLHAQEPVQLESGKTIEREIAVGQRHTYQLTLVAGQFMRVIVEQKGIDVEMALIAPDNQQVMEIDSLSGAVGPESLSHEASLSGNYRIVVRTVDPTPLKGTYQVRLEVKAAATSQDKQRIAAERLVMEAINSWKKGAATAQTTIEKAQQAVEAWRALGERSAEASTLSIITLTYFSVRKYNQAIDHDEQALVIRRELKDRLEEGNLLNRIGNTYWRLYQYEKAIAYHEQALTIFRELKDRAREGNTLFNLGFAYSRLNQSENAIAYYEQALTISRAAKERSLESGTLFQLGNVYRLLSRYEKAIAYHEQALVIHREAKNRGGEADMLKLLGDDYDALHLYEKMVEYYGQALTIHREIKNRRGEGNTLMNLCHAYFHLNQSEKIIEYAEQALALSREIKNRDSESSALNYLGLAYRMLNQYEKAITYHEQGLAILREMKNQVGEGNTLGSLGKTYLALNQYEKAIAYHEQALRIFREINDRRGEAGTLNDLGNDHRLLSQYEKASGYYEQALRIQREIRNRDGEANTYNSMMLTWQASKQPSLAIFFGKQAVNTYQEIRGNLRELDQETQQGFLKSREQTYRTLADLLISLGRLPEAEQVIRLLKEDEYFDYIRRDETNAPKTEKATLTPEELALDRRYREIADKLTEIGAERTTLLDKPSRTHAEEQRLTKLEADLVVAGQSFQKFLDGLAAEMGKNADTNARAFQLRESQGLMEDLRELGKGVVALYTLVGEDKYRVILTTADFQKGYEYSIKADELNRKVLAFRDVLQNPKLDPLPLAQELYKILVGPVAKDLQGTKAQMVMWSLDGVLRYVPVAALHDGKQYLVERYRTAVFTPASQSRLRVEPSRKWTALGLGVTKAHGLTIPALPGVAEEMRGIIKAEGTNSGVLPGSIKLDEAFTQEAMLTELRKRNPVVHIASHFRFQPGNETNSALLLGDGQFLSLAQIKSLPNVFAGVDLLTLSACNTATGGSGANGKEVEGFGVLAQRQGAKAVVASLWPVADRSTKHLMQEFYKLREAKAEVTKIEALRQAQIKLLRGELQVTGEALAAREIVHEAPKATNQPPFKPDAKAPYAHPYYWAPFILIGNWK